MHAATIYDARGDDKLMFFSRALFGFKTISDKISSVMARDRFAVFTQDS